MLFNVPFAYISTYFINHMAAHCYLMYKTWPTACDEIPAEFVQWSDTQAIVSIAFSCLGFLSTAFAGAVFVRYNDTPVVKSSTRELSYLILAGMTLSHAATFPILAKPSWLSCCLSRLLPGLSFAMIYASLLTKTNRIARILAGSKKRFPTRKPRFMSAAAQVCIWNRISLKVHLVSVINVCRTVTFGEDILPYCT